MDDFTEFGELSHDEDFKSKFREFEGNLDQVERMIQNFCCSDVYDKIKPVDKVRYDLFQAFALSSLYWFYLRIKGTDPNQHEIRSELNRIKEFMARSKKIYEKQTLMPKINQDAAKRFIRSGLWDPKTPASWNENEGEQNAKSRKRKRESATDDDDDDDNDLKPAKSANFVK